MKARLKKFQYMYLDCTQYSCSLSFVLGLAEEVENNDTQNRVGGGFIGKGKLQNCPMWIEPK